MYTIDLKKKIGEEKFHYRMRMKTAEKDGLDTNVLRYDEAIKALESLEEMLGLDKDYEDEGRYVYGVRIFLGEMGQPMAELAFGDGGKPNGETKIIHWTHPDERDRYVINGYTFIWDERTKDIAYGGSFEEYKNYGN